MTFNCGDAATIIDGGSLITISGGNTVGVFSVNTGVNFTVQNLTIANGNSVYGYGAGYDQQCARRVEKRGSHGP